MGAGKGKKARNFGPPALGPPPFGPPPFGAPPFGAPHFGPPTLGAPTLGALTFSCFRPHPSGPHPSGHHPCGPRPFGFHPSAPLPSSGGPRGLHFFWVWAPAFLILIMLLICFFCAFIIVSISCHFFENFAFFSIFFYISHFSSWGPKPQTSFQFGRGVLPPQTSN